MQQEQAAKQLEEEHIASKATIEKALEEERSKTKAGLIALSD